MKKLLIGCCITLAIIVLGLGGFVLFKQLYQDLDYENELVHEEQDEEIVKTTQADIVCVGDFVIHQAIIESKHYQPQTNEFDFSNMFHYIKDVYQEGDFTFATLEGALCESDYSGYPLFRTPSQLIDDVKASGIDLINMANNHVYDDYHQGVLHSAEVLNEKQMDYQGIQTSQEQKNYYIKEINGIKVGFFNYVYETMDGYGNPGINGITLDEESIPLINSYSDYDLEGLYQEVDEILKAFQTEGVEYSIAVMHWGDEYQHYPNDYQQAIAQAFCDMGIDALIGSHPHVVQTTDLLVSSDGSHEMLCAYSLGNHISNQRVEYMDGISNGNTEDGLIVKLSLFKNEQGEVVLQDVEWIPTWVYYEYDPVNLSYYQIIPLTKYEEIIEDKKIDFSVDAIDSLNRTNSLIQTGIDKIEAALPLQ